MCEHGVCLEHVKAGTRHCEYDGVGTSSTEYKSIFKFAQFNFQIVLNRKSFGKKYSVAFNQLTMIYSRCIENKVNLNGPTKKQKQTYLS